MTALFRHLVLLLTPALALAAEFSQLGVGSLGEINARDGDRAFNAAYYDNAVLAGAPATTRLETYVGSEADAPAGLAAPRLSARWTGTLTPAVSGVFPVRVSGPIALRIDGKLLAETEAGADPATVHVPMRQGRPYEILVEAANWERGVAVAVEWGRPAPLPEEATSEPPAEIQAGPVADASIGNAATLENESYRADSRADGALVLTEKRSGARAVFAPEFVVVHQRKGQQTRMDPKGGKYLDEGSVGNTNYVVPSWEKEADYLVAARPRTRLHANAARQEGDRIVWDFPEQPGYALRAEVRLPDDGTAPALSFELKPKEAGQFSVGYAGAPARAMRDADWIWQPLVWQERRFPNRSYLTKEFQCPIPFVMAGFNGAAVGVGADAAEMPYRMPTISDSRFGVLVRNAAGEAQPMLFAPILGGPESIRAPGENYTFRLRLVVRQGSWFDAYEHLARSLYRFGDVRENLEVSLNTTIENMTDYFLRDEFAYWYPRYKTWGYQNDGGPGTGRQQSAADAISLALVFDRAEILERRARPTLEYALSRKSNTTKFDAADFMGGFVNYPVDMAASYRLTGGRTTVLREKLAPAMQRPISAATPILTDRDGLALNLAWYRVTKDREYLERAVAAGDRYVAARIARPAADFGDVRSSFWTELAPGYDVLYELYRESGEKRFLAKDRAWLSKVTNVVSEHWRQKNLRKKGRSLLIAENGPSQIDLVA
ncbi:MAG TPA: PA14 domain-containing protein [Opitutus sp.]|nr:PA14 domain-containing protein [Opitutus sp.]